MLCCHKLAAIADLLDLKRALNDQQGKTLLYLMREASNRMPPSTCIFCRNDAYKVR